jgi:hypothetical protein
MMRLVALIPLCILAACSDTDAADQKAAQVAEANEAALKLDAGQWETTTEITAVDSQDNGKPVLKVGKSVASACIAETERKHPPVAVLAGMDKAGCSYDNFYMSRGRINAAMRCDKTPGVPGTVLVSSDGHYTAATFETDTTMQTYLSGDGDAKATAKVSGKRVGACTAPAAA